MYISGGSLLIYKTIVMKGIKFSSQHAKEISTIDYFVRLKDGDIASIIFFTILDSKLYALVQIYQPITPIKDHLIRIETSNLKKVIQLRDISEKVIFLKFGPHKEYITSFPNKYEKT